MKFVNRREIKEKRDQSRSRGRSSQTVKWNQSKENVLRLGYLKDPRRIAWPYC